MHMYNIYKKWHESSAAVLAVMESQTAAA